jgi:hypothetical protein
VKLHHAPGGSSSIQIGGGYDQPSYKAKPMQVNNSPWATDATQEPARKPAQITQAEMFGQRIGSGMNSGPHTGVSSTKIHAPPGGKSNFSLY